MLKFFFAGLLGMPVSSFAHSAYEDACLTALTGGVSQSAGFNARQRQMSMGLELLKIKSDVEPNQLHVMVVEKELQELSRQNLLRLMDEIPEPPLRLVTRAEKLRLEELVGSLSFIAVTRIDPATSGEPLQPWPDTYSNLVGGSRTLGLKVLATADPSNLRTLQGLIGADSARAPEDFVRRFGVMVPEFGNTQQILNFFRKWEPELLEQVLRGNRHNLPNHVKTVRQMQEWMTPDRLKGVLPDHSLSARLAPLRQNLHRFLLTATDAEVFYRHMMLAYMQLAMETGVRRMADYEKTWRLPGGPGFLLQETMAAIGWADGASLRVPLNLPSYSIIRYEEVRPPDPRRGLRPDHRRLDHRDRP